MVEEKGTQKEAVVEVERSFEQPSDAISFFSDSGQVLYTGNEVVLQFYETIPGPPAPDGSIKNVRSKLRATVTLSLSHARNIGKLLVEKAKEIEK
jgi:hypothetical protein